MNRDSANAPHILLCAPDYFDVSYRINPWMDPAAWREDEKRYAVLARSQWQGLHDVLHTLGARIELVPPVSKLPDMVFTANGGLVLDRTVVLPNFRCPERQGETPHFAACFAALKARGVVDEVRSLPASVAFEGAGDCLWDPTREVFWMGYGQRSQAAAAPLIADIYRKPAVALELVDPRFYHLDVSLRPLGKGHLLYYPGAFSAAGLEEITARAGGADDLIPVDEKDASQFAVNCVAFGDHIIMSDASPALRERLAALGYTVHFTQLRAFHRSGGSALCLTLRLDQHSSLAAAAASEKTAA